MSTETTVFLGSNFAKALLAHLNSLHQPLSRWEHRLKRYAETPDQPHSQRVLARTERGVRADQGYGNAVIDWLAANIDWKLILQICLALLPLILAVLGPGPMGAGVESAGDWFPGKNLIEQFLPEIIAYFVVPTLRKGVEDQLALTNDAWRDKLLAWFAASKAEVTP